MSLSTAYALKRRKKMASGGQMCEHGKTMCHMCHGGKMMADGGFVKEEETSGYEHMPEEHEKMDHRAMEEDDRMLNQHGEHEVAAMDMDEDNEPQHERMVHHAEENQGFPEDEEDMVSRIMKKQQQHYAHGGKVDHMAKGGEPDFDRLHESVDERTGYGMDEEPEEEHEDEEHETDMVGKIMKKRSMSYSEGGKVANFAPPIADSEPAEFDDLVLRDDLNQHYTGENSGDEIGNEQEDEDRHDIVSRIMKSRRLKDRMPRPA